MLNTRGPKQGRGLLLQNVVKATMLYGAPTWAHATRIKSYMRGLQSTYRLGALRVCSAFRTVSEDAALVIAGMLPLELLATERAVTHSEKRSGSSESHRLIARRAREASICQWQTKWDASTKGRWTHRLIPDLAKWLNRKSGFVNFHLTQILSGHGCFRSYLCRFGHESDPYCLWCYPEVEETAEHILFNCRRFSAEREALESAVGASLTVHNIISCMIDSEECWSAVCAYAVKTTTTLRNLERERRRNRNGAGLT